MKIAIIGYGKMGHEVEKAARARKHNIIVTIIITIVIAEVGRTIVFGIILLVICHFLAILLYGNNAIGSCKVLRLTIHDNPYSSIGEVSLKNRISAHTHN